MKITADVNSIIPGGINIKQSAGVLSRNIKRRNQTAPTSRNFQNSFISRLQRERAFGDALSIAQMSNSIIQKVMNVTSRLRSIALQAFRGSGVKADDLNQALSQIDNLIGEYGESVSKPVITGRQETGSSIVTVVENLKSIMENAVGMKPDGRSNFINIDAQLERLSGMEKASTKEIEIVKESMNRILKEYPAFKNAEIAVMNRKVVDMINQSPVDALKSHDSLYADRTHINIIR